MAIDKKFWNGTSWERHLAFQTVNHTHVSCFSPAEGFEDCDIMTVECKDGRWFVEDYWGDLAPNTPGVWSRFSPSDEEPTFFDSEDAALRHAVAVVARVSGVSELQLLEWYLSE